MLWFDLDTGSTRMVEEEKEGQSLYSFFQTLILDYAKYWNENSMNLAGVLNTSHVTRKQNWTKIDNSSLHPLSYILRPW